MDEPPPGRYFISHSYLDKEACERLLKKLPPHVEPRCFPRINVPPEELVSDELIDALLDCDGLIYLEGGHSARSFWVAFERDYALRAGKKVFSADPQTCALTGHRRPPLDLAAYAVHHRSDFGRVREVITFLKRDRHFDLHDGDDIRPGGSIQNTLAERIEGVIGRGGYAVVFWSREAGDSPWVRHEIEQAARDMSSDFNDRVLFGLLDADALLPRFWQNYQEPGVQLYGDAERPEKHRRDDLVVRLYWLIYRKTEQRHLD